MNKTGWSDISVVEAINLIKNEKMFLPDIQRDYVWDRKDIERLFDSIVDEYPVGTFVIWKTTKHNLEQIKPNLYRFSNQIIRNDKKPEGAEHIKNSSPFRDEGDYYIVLDGQQRITSYYIALTGYYKAQQKSGQQKQNYPEYYLYYNLEYENDIQNDEEAEKFKFLNKEEYDQEPSKWFPIHNAYSETDEMKYYQTLFNYSQTAQNDLRILWQRINSNDRDKGLIHFYSINEDQYDKTLDIFLRVNSTGKRLTKMDLLFSTMVDGWPEIKDEIPKFVSEMNSSSNGSVQDLFGFTQEHIIRSAAILVGANTKFSIESFDLGVRQKMRTEWQKIKKVMVQTKQLIEEMRFSNDTLGSYNALVPIYYYLFKGGKIDNDNKKNEVRKYLAITSANRVFGSSSNSMLEYTIKRIDEALKSNKEFSRHIFEDNTNTNGDKFIVSKDTINGWLIRLKKGASTYPILVLLQPRLDYIQESYDQDHLHCQNQFEDVNIKKYKFSDEQNIKSKRDLLPNLWLLNEKDNRGEKNKKPLDEWLDLNPKYKDNIPYLDKGISYKFDDFEIFFKNREDKIRKELENIFDIK